MEMEMMRSIEEEIRSDELTDDVSVETFQPQ